MLAPSQNLEKPWDGWIPAFEEGLLWGRLESSHQWDWESLDLDFMSNERRFQVGARLFRGRIAAMKMMSER